MKNRVGITVRFNIEQQANLRSLCKFWGMDEKKVLKFAFEQLVVSTEQMNRQLQEKEKANESNSIPAIRPGTVDDNVAGDNSSDATPADSAGSEPATDTAPAA